MVSIKQETNIKYCLLTMGLEYLLTKNINICLTAVGISYSIDANRRGHVEDTMVHYDMRIIIFNMKSKGYYIQTGLGVTYVFLEL